MNDATVDTKVDNAMVDCKGGCARQLAASSHPHSDPGFDWYGVFTKDKLTDMVCTDCYAKGVRMEGQT